MSSTDQRVILVTGANKGIGFEAVRLLSEKLPSATILLGTRSPSNGEAALTKLRQAGSYTNIHVLSIEVTDPASIAQAVDEVKSKYGHLDVLINNAGISNVNGERLHPAVLDVNFYGVHRVVEAFLPILSPHSTLITVSSEVGAWSTDVCSPDLQKRLLDPAHLTWEELDTLAQAFLKEGRTPWPDPFKFSCYGVSKALVSAYTRMVAVAHPNLTVVVVCPGYCATDLNHHSGHRSAAQGGESIIQPVLHKLDTGKFYQDGKEMEWCCPPPSWYKGPPPRPSKQ